MLLDGLSNMLQAVGENSQEVHLIFYFEEFECDLAL